MSLAIMLSRFFQTARLHSHEIFSPIVGLFLVCYLFSIGTISAMSLLVLAIAAVAVFGFTSIVLLRNDLKMASLDERSNITDTPPNGSKTSAARSRCIFCDDYHYRSYA